MNLNYRLSLEMRDVEPLVSNTTNIKEMTFFNIDQEPRNIPNPYIDSYRFWKSLSIDDTL